MGKRSRQGLDPLTRLELLGHGRYAEMLRSVRPGDDLGWVLSCLALHVVAETDLAFGDGVCRDLTLRAFEDHAQQHGVAVYACADKRTWPRARLPLGCLWPADPLGELRAAGWGAAAAFLGRVPEAKLAAELQTAYWQMLRCPSSAPLAQMRGGGLRALQRAAVGFGVDLEAYSS